MAESEQIKHLSCPASPAQSLKRRPAHERIKLAPALSCFVREREVTKAYEPSQVTVHPCQGIVGRPVAGASAAQDSTRLPYDGDGFGGPP